MKADERKKVIMECAKRLFSKKGYYNTQISDIIDDAKIARGTVYQYFKNKDDIFITLIKDYYANWEQTISIDMTRMDLKTITPREYFNHRVKNTLQFLANDPELCNIVLRMGIGLSGDMESAIRRFEKKIHNLIAGDIELGIRNRHVRKDINIDLVSNLITGALLKTAHYFFVNKRKKKKAADIEKMSWEIINIFSPAIFKGSD
jgi:AcrR family transcriptional regulator